jgi:hypothetical protein
MQTKAKIKSVKSETRKRHMLVKSKYPRCITDFYKELYSTQPMQKKNDINFYANCPKLSEEQTNFLIKI